MDSELKIIKDILEADDMRLAVKNSYPEDYNSTLVSINKAPYKFPVDATSNMSIGIITTKLSNYLKDKKKDVDQFNKKLRVLDDKIVKATDLVQNADRSKDPSIFQLMGKRLDCDIESIVLIKKGDTSKLYEMIVDYLVYDSEWFSNQLNETVEYCKGMDAQSKENHLKQYTDTMSKAIYNQFMEKHGYLVSYEPYCRKIHYTGQKAAQVLKVYHSWIDYLHQSIGGYANLLSAQLEYLQLLKQAYDNLINRYSKDKDIKNAVDIIFKALIRNSEMSMEFNNKAAIILNEMMDFYTKELDQFIKIYSGNN